MKRLVILLAVCAVAPLGGQRLSRPRVSGVELEAQVSAAQATQGEVMRQEMSGFGPGWSGGAQLFWQAPAEGARMRVPFTTSTAGRTDLMLWFTRAPDYGQFDLRIDGGAPVTIDGYAREVGRDSVLVGAFDLTAGAHELLLAVSGKDRASRGFLVGLDRLGWQPATSRSAAPASGAQPPAAASGLIGNIANASPSTRATRVPVIRLRDAAALQQGLQGQGIQGGVISAPANASRVAAPLSRSDKAAIVTAALGSLGPANSSLMSQHGLQVDEEGTMRLTAARPVIEGRADLSFGDAISYSAWPLVRFRLYPPSSPLSQQVKPFFNVEFKADAADQPFLLDCEVDVAGEAVFETAGQTVTLSGVTRHYTLLAVTPKAGWNVVSVVLRSGKLIPGGIWMGVDLRSCEITPLK